MSDTIPPEAQRAIIMQEIAGLQQAAYLVSMRYKVNKKLGATSEELKPIEDNLLKIELQIAEWQKELEAIK